MRHFERNFPMFRSFFGALALAALLIAPASAHSVNVGDLSLTDLWTRATPPNAQAAAGYLTITNKGGAADKLVGAASPSAEKTGLHEMAIDNGVMKMRPVEGIDIPAGGSVTLAPNGLHIMFTGLKEPFKEGSKLPVTLTFEKAGKVETFLHILAVGATGPSGGGHDHGGGEMKMDTTP
jgi:copper(I)-binding protein